MKHMSPKKTLEGWKRLQAAADALNVRDDRDSTEDEMRRWIEAQKAADNYLAALRAEDGAGRDGSD
jgi:hypothetical protein